MSRPPAGISLREWVKGSIPTKSNPEAAPAEEVKIAVVRPQSQPAEPEAPVAVKQEIAAEAPVAPVEAAQVSPELYEEAMAGKAFKKPIRFGDIGGRIKALAFHFRPRLVGKLLAADAPE